ncbi:MAG: type restriction enzyme subunit [Thermoanaerobaculia bacterium]|nr:type restriction enzyme subunit [Thermoanaerobaculia bacterium]
MRGQTIGTDLDRYKILPPGAFAYNPMRINIGSIARWPGNHHVLVSPDYVVFEAIPGKLDGRFLDHYRRSHPWKHFMEAAGNGGVRVRVYYNDLAALKLPLPPLTEQQRIADLLDLLDREISLLERQRELLEKQKRAVMHKLLTGEVRLATTE